jgi:hypothetical protein
MMRSREVFGILCLAALAPAVAQNTVDISRCMDIHSSAERMRCYDALADEVRARSRPAAAVSAPEEEVRSFGKESPAPVVDTRNGVAELHDRIESLRSTPAGDWIVTLASGQVWQQSVPGRYNLRNGLEVRIYPSKWGKTYRLTAPELKGFIQVRRLK